MIDDARGQIDYHEEGSGPTILCVPGSWGTRSAWRGVSAALTGRFRIVTTNLLGYGSAVERRTTADLSIEREAEIIEAASRQAGGRVHLVGHSYGSQVCLAVAIRQTGPLASLCLIEPTGVNLLRRAGELALCEQIIEVRDAYFHAFERGEKEAARHVIDLHDGDGSFDALPSRARFRHGYHSHQHSGLAFEPWLGCAIVGLLGDHRSRLAICGGRGHAYVARSVGILSGAMPNASLATMGAGPLHDSHAYHRGGKNNRRPWLKSGGAHVVNPTTREDELTDGQGRAVSTHKTQQSCEDYAKHTPKRMLSANNHA